MLTQSYDIASNVSFSWKYDIVKQIYLVNASSWMDGLTSSINSVNLHSQVQYFVFKISRSCWSVSDAGKTMSSWVSYVNILEKYEDYG